MKTKVVRDIIRIDEAKCDGCGACALKCAEGAIEIYNGKARLISENYCDGLGACLGECPQGALTIEKRESEEFDEEAVKHHLEAEKPQPILPCGCPSSTIQQFKRDSAPHAGAKQESILGHWPVQLALVAPTAPFLKGADLLLAAHCGPFAYGNFHQEFIKGKAVVCACPKLDDFQAHQQKLTEILRRPDIKSLTVVRMEVPCCGGLTFMAREAIRASGKDIPIREVVISAKGEIVK
ncbi:MAG: 4Fe-4S ferredoxin [Chloroflexi bacterium]|nr:4Fe-4S ferredoxin [Chloroflexota bacterium]